MKHCLRVLGPIFAFALLPLSETQSLAAEKEQKYATVLEQGSYTAEYGDTLSGIALRFRSSVDELMAKDLNPRLRERGNPNLIYAGERIALPYFHATVVPQKDVPKETRVLTTLGALEEMQKAVEEAQNRIKNLQAALTDTKERLSRTETLLKETDGKLMRKDEAFVESYDEFVATLFQARVHNADLTEKNGVLATQVKKLETQVNTLEDSAKEKSKNIAGKEETILDLIMIIGLLVILAIGLALFPFHPSHDKRNTDASGGNDNTKNTPQDGAAKTGMKSASPPASQNGHDNRKFGEDQVIAMLRTMSPDKAVDVVKKSLTGKALLALSEAPLARDHRNNPIKLGNIARTIEKHPNLKYLVPSEWGPEFFETEKEKTAPASVPLTLVDVK